MPQNIDQLIVQKADPPDQESSQQLISPGSLRRFFRRGVPSVLVRIVGTGLAFAVSIVLARAMGPDGFGVYSFAVAAAILLSVLAQAGIPTLLVREVAIYQATMRWSLMRGLLSKAWRLVVLLSFGAILLIVLIFLMFPWPLEVVQRTTLIWALVLIPCFALNACIGSVLRGLGFVIRGQVAEQLVRPGLFLALVVGALLTTDIHSIEPSFGMLLHAVSAVGALLVGAILLSRTLPQSLRNATSAFADQDRWKRSLLPLGFLAGLQIINSQADILMLGVFVDARDVGIYRVAWQGANVVNLLLLAIGLTVGPEIARLHGTGDYHAIQRMVRTSGRGAFLLSLAVSVILILFGEEILVTVFGEAFEDSYTPLVILCLGQVALAFSGWAVLVLNMTGNERITARYTAYAAVANIAANGVMIPLLGTIGAALATASTMFVWKLILAMAARRTTGLNTTVAPLTGYGSGRGDA